MSATNPLKSIRASLLPTLFSCVRALQYKGDAVSNEYAETGSLIHAGIEAYHKLQSIDSALAVMSIKQADFPEANSSKAAHHFRRYTETERQWGAVTGTERQISFALAPASIDPTQEEIVITGTLDQIRTTHAVETVVDAKTGSKPIKWMMRHYVPQLCAYQYGYYIETGKKAHGAILRTMDFLQGGKIFHPVPWGWETVLDVMESVKVLVALYRAGLKIAIPGDHCDYCPAGGIEHCSTGTKAEKGRYSLPLATSIEDLFK